MTHSVERRAKESLAFGKRETRDDLLEPFLRSDASRGVTGDDEAESAAQETESASLPANLGLTRRERKVKDLLLRELKKISDGQLLSYDAIQNIEKTLNVDWIDEQLDKMRREYRRSPWLWALFFGMALVYILVFGGTLIGEASSFISGFAVIFLPVAFAAPYFQRRALRRRVFIFEALRELAGADEAGVTLDQAIKDADALITRIVDRELAGEAVKPTKTIGRHRIN